jgi:hypothetical protein|nr:MAG TPA: hypothetical protein [Caudoviricetes sp.]
MDYISIQSSKDVIRHFGIKGMKWGMRRSKIRLLPRLQPTLQFDAKTAKLIKGQPRYNDAKKFRTLSIQEKQRKDKIGMSPENIKKYDSLSEKLWTADKHNNGKEFDRIWAEREKFVMKTNPSARM